MKAPCTAIAALLLGSSATQAALIAPQSLSEGRQAGTLAEYHLFGTGKHDTTVGTWLKSVCNTDFTSYFDDQDQTLHRSYACTLAQQVGPHAAGTLVVINKRNQGPAIFGVNPIALNTAQDGMLVTGARCTATGLAPDVAVAAYTCTGVVKRRAHAGISDFEPARYSDEVTADGIKATLNLPSGNDDAGEPWRVLTPGEIGSMDTRSITQTVFGVAVNLALRNAMQRSEGLVEGSDADEDLPSMPGSFYAAAVAGFVKGGSPHATWRTLTGLPGDEIKQVNLCRQVDGGATQVAANLFFLKAGALLSDANGMLVPLRAAGSFAVQGSLAVTEVGPAASLADCVTDPALGTNGYAMALLPLTEAPGGEAWRFVKLDGVAPTKAQARIGAYPLVYAATMQFTSSGWLTEAQKQFLSAMRQGIASPATIAALPAPVRQDAWLASPTTYAASCAAATGADRQHGSCVERLDFGSAFNVNTFINGEAQGFRTSSKQPLHFVK